MSKALFWVGQGGWGWRGVDGALCWVGRGERVVSGTLFWSGGIMYC